MTRTEKRVFLADTDDPEFIAAYPHAADVTVDHITDLLDYNLPDLLGPRGKERRNESHPTSP